MTINKQKTNMEYQLYIVEQQFKMALIRLNLATQESKVVAKGDNIRLSRIKNWMIKTQEFSRFCVICNSEYPPIVSNSKTCSSACQKKLNSKNVTKNYLKHRKRLENQNSLVKDRNKSDQKPLTWADKQVRFDCWCLICNSEYQEYYLQTKICDRCLSISSKERQKENICKK